MAKRRLLRWMRERLYNHAKCVVSPEAEGKALDSAYAKAAPLVLACVAKRFPPADMAVLKKYEAGYDRSEVKVQFPSGVVAQFDLAQEDYTYGPDYASRVYLVDEKTASAVDQWATAKEKYTKTREDRLKAYRALIDGSGYVEDLLGWWPEVEQILPLGSPLIPLGPEQIDLVKADLKERKVAA